jgi:hypothetical protein
MRSATRHIRPPPPPVPAGRLLPRPLGVLVMFLMVAALLPAGVARAGTTYYVSTAGNDAAAGSSSSPWRTIGRSLTRLSAGDTLLVRAGTYVERITAPKLRAGTSALRIKVAAYPGERPVIQGLLWLHSPTYWTFDGISVTWSATNSTSEHMVKLINGVGWSFINGEIWGARSYAAVLVTGDVANQPADWRIANNCIHDTYPTHGLNQDHNIYLNTGLTAGAGTLEHNLVFNATNGRNLKMGPSGSSGGSVNVAVRYNTFYNAIQPVSPSYDTNHNRFDWNIIGKSQGTYGAIHAYVLRGTDNVAANNITFATPKLLTSTGGGVPVANGGGNQFLDPRFDSVASCSGFHPQAAAAAGFGRYAGVAPADKASTTTPVRSWTLTPIVAPIPRKGAPGHNASTAVAAAETATPSKTPTRAAPTAAPTPAHGKDPARAHPPHGGGKPPKP